jgi:hypothetical protein
MTAELSAIIRTYHDDLKNCLSNGPRFCVHSDTVFSMAQVSSDIGQSWQDAGYALDAPEYMPAGAVQDNGQGHPVPEWIKREGGTV